MVRVNYPPGGESHLGSEAKREPKTVRVLKPPGGESSICFTDDDFTKRPVKNGASPPSTPTTSECSNGSLQKDDTNSDNVKSDSPVEEACQFEAASNQTNGMANGSEEVRDSQPLPSPPIQSESSPEPSFDRETSPQPNTNGCSSPDAESSNQINGDSEYSPKVTPDVADSGISDGENEPSLAPLSINSVEPPSTPTPSSPTTPTPPSPSIRPDEDTKTRVLGHSVPCPPTSNVPSASISTSNREAAPRKVVDHMRSNIFMSDEDYTPTRTSRFTAPKPAEQTQNVQQTAPAAAPQRQRIPPGGFSTKLW